MIPTAILDPEWAKRQLILLTREWYMHPSGALVSALLMRCINKLFVYMCVLCSMFSL